MEKVQYSAALIITGAIKGTSRECLYKELGLESLCDRRWYRKLVFFYKIVKGLTQSYFQSYLLPDNKRTYNTRSRKTFLRGYQLFAQLFSLLHKRMELIK